MLQLRTKASGRQKHLVRDPSADAPVSAVDRAMRALTPLLVLVLGGRQAALRAILGASDSAIKGWRSGRRRAPAWARDILAGELERRAAEMLAAAQALRQNEKPASTGGPPVETRVGSR